MTALVAVETVLLVVLVVLVAGLLRSHAEILRRLGPADEGGLSGVAASGASDPGLPVPARGARPDADRPAPAIQGSTPHGDEVALSLGAHGAPPTLLAFLSSGCSTCSGFWSTLAEPRLPEGVETVIVTRGSERERLLRVRELAPDGVPVVMSTRAWEEYQVPGSPYFILVHGSVRGEGVATSWSALASLVGDAMAEDAAGGHDGELRQLADGIGIAGAGGRDIDAILTSSGIGPDHPSLYPAGRGAPPPA